MESSLPYIKPDAADFRSVARALTIVENDLAGSGELLKSLTFKNNAPIIGITGPPGAGKSTLVNSLINSLLTGENKIAVLAVDPTSPFNFGSLLGDRIRMAAHFNHPGVFIRSLATRGSLGGLSAKTIEMTDVLRAAGFNYILVETVGVGQSEVEIAGLADITLLVLVPESGDEIQNIKSGLMEIADAFIINKADRADADLFANNLKKIIHQNRAEQIPVFKTIASTGGGVSEVTSFIFKAPHLKNKRKAYLLAEKAFKIIQFNRMADIDKKRLQEDIAKASAKPGFNFYRFLEGYQKN
ncbi:methylmalonyl Co-A mutase-associated GTPase MeaB [Mucilaginibacter gotjawali]|uniref:LAO/AO transport system kinase n=2 Tax=Mucilaginibacter gotjawali TaxID=1550579 RepID=A0A839SDY3_9SPHI|nr:methylmalonyl Co-A mutase-associated GTPase MeaB [Mucilaginibacter gotjawali]MBB3055100.1 LAO/AO transport system kinase [Mucilaginibacter gotjawali]BAU56282.1 putative GTPase/MT1543 [Mucilaginibacter gotjawali]